MRPAFEEFPDSAIRGHYCAINSGFARGEQGCERNALNLSGGLFGEVSQDRPDRTVNSTFKIHALTLLGRGQTTALGQYRDVTPRDLVLWN